jgi:hypothetical protein
MNRFYKSNHLDLQETRYYFIEKVSGKYVHFREIVRFDNSEDLIVSNTQKLTKKHFFSLDEKEYMEEIEYEPMFDAVLTPLQKMEIIKGTFKIKII